MIGFGNGAKTIRNVPKQRLMTDGREKYCKATTVAEALSCGASLRDLDSDFKHKYLAIREPQLALPAPSDMESEDLGA